MKNRYYFVVVLLLLASSLYSQDQVKLKNRMDSISYAVGVSMYNGSLQFKITLDYDMLVAGVLAAADSSALFETEYANDFIARISQQLSNEMIEREMLIGKRFMNENKKVEGMNVTQSGLQYRIIKQGDSDSPHPTENDKVKVNYTGYLLNGTKFDASEDRGGPAVFSVNQVIKGWTEVLKLMSVGAEYVVYIPPHLAYGDRQMGKDIKPGSTLIFEIELLEIVKR